LSTRTRTVWSRISTESCKRKNSSVASSNRREGTPE
jgi:hypothetical protein